MSENVQDIRASHKLHHGKMESAISNKWTNASRISNQKKHLPERITLTTAIY